MIVGFEGEILAGAAALLAAILAFKGVKVRIEHSVDDKGDKKALRYESIFFTPIRPQQRRFRSFR